MDEKEGFRYYDKPVDEVLQFFASDDKKGLSKREIEERLKKFGPNVLEEKGKINPIFIFFNQFRSFIIYILIFALVFSVLVEEYIDSVVIGAILIFNAFFGFIQEYKAEKAIEKLRELSGFKSRVVREGEVILVDSKELVQGDIILIEEGDKISADARIIESKNLKVSEASLTGESIPVLKVSEVLYGDLSIADRKNLLYSGTNVAKGRARAVVVATGMKSEIGKIAGMISAIEKDETPLQKKLSYMGRWIGVFTILVSISVFFAGVFRDGLIGLLFSRQYYLFVISARDWFLTAVALAVAAVPEGLPAIVTIALALGVRRMLKRNSLIRRLPSVETLGSTNVICSDKTGTLTSNEMMVRKVFVNSNDLDIEGKGYELNGKISKLSRNDLFIFQIGVLCNNASLNVSGNKVDVIGDPTEAALLVSAERAGVKHVEFRKLWLREDEESFDSERKMMSTVNIDPKTKKKIVFSKGAPERILEKCNRVIINGKVVKLNASLKKKILEKNKEFAKQALRVLGFAFKDFKGKIEEDLIFVGLQAMHDPPRKEVKESILKCNNAGIRVIMVTGDNLYTALAIAKEIGIEGESIESIEFSKLSNREKLKMIEKISIFARVDPAHKVEIVELLQKKKYVVAMTGDGVNDAPAIKKADIGIAMGIKGTDVAKETSDMVLIDDNFASIVNSVEEGRGIYQNIKKFVNYLLSSNMAEVLVIFLAIIFGMPLPMTAIMLLWINLVTDGLPALSLSVDPPSRDIMKSPARRAERGIMNRSMVFNVVYVALLISFGVLGLFVWAQNYYEGTENMIERAQTIAFTAIVIMEFVRLHMIRSEHNLDAFSNKWLVLAVAVSFALQVAVIYTPLNQFFGTTFLGFRDWAMIFGVSFGVFVLNLIGSKVRDRIKFFNS